MFSLLNGWLALGALGGSIPIVIHLLNRRRFRIVRWAAMEFLLASLRKNFRRVRIENLLLLLLRVLMIVLLALAIARPVITESGLMSALGTESRHVVIILDNSLSMRYREGADTCFSRAQGAARGILESLNKGDVASLLAMSDAAEPMVKEATLDIDLVKREVKRAEAGWGGTDVRKALVAAADLLSASKKPRKDIFIITDMQARGWGKKGEKPSAELRAALDRLAEEAKVFVVDVGCREPENLAVTRLVPSFKVVGTGSSTEFQVEVTNFGRTRKSGVRVSFLIDKFNQDARKLDIAPGETEAATFSHTFHKKGAHVVQVRLSEDRLAADNLRHLAVNVEEFVPVLLVNGETSTEIDENETYHIARALKPPAAPGSPRPSHIEPTTITEFDISATDFEKYRLVVLANLASLPAEDVVPRLEDYVKQGGALVVFLGDRVDATFYNQRLFKDGAGLLPARLGLEVGSVGEDKKAVHIDLAKPVHPAFQHFTGETAFYVTRSILFFKYFDLKLPKDTENIRVVAQFDTGSPAIVERTYGRGRVMLFASSCDTEWNNFARRAAYPVVMNDLVSHLATGDYEQRNVIVHQPYRRTFAPEELIETVKIRPPGDAAQETELRPYPVRTAPKKDRPDSAMPVVTEILFPDTDIAGPHELEPRKKDGTKHPIEYFAVNSPPEESDLKRYSADEAKEAIKGLEFKYATGVTDLELAVRQSRTGSELARSILLALLAVCCIELILGQRFGR